MSYAWRVASGMVDYRWQARGKSRASTRSTAIAGAPAGGATGCASWRAWGSVSDPQPFARQHDVDKQLRH